MDLNKLVTPKALQSLIAYASIVMAVLTQALSGIHLSPTASAVLGVFGVLLHPGTSVTAPPPVSSSKPPAPPPPGG